MGCDEEQTLSAWFSSLKGTSYYLSKKTGLCRYGYSKDKIVFQYLKQRLEEDNYYSVVSY